MQNNIPHNVIIGNGQIGRELVRKIPNPILLTRENVDLSDPRLLKIQLHEALDNKRVCSIINTAAFTDVDGAETRRDEAMAVNAKAPKIIAEYCEKYSIPLIHYSTDFIFDGNKEHAYTEDDNPSPINYYGETKLLGENAIIQTCSKYIILRVAWVYSMYTENNFVKKILSAATKNKELFVVDDQFGAPCNAHDVAIQTLTVLSSIRNITKIFGLKENYINCQQEEIWGVYHLSPQNFVSRFDFAQSIVSMANLYSDLSLENVKISPCKTDNSKAIAKRPLNSMLNSGKITEKLNIKMRNWDKSLENAFKNLKIRL